jgi:hypothetical protein
MWDPWFLVTKNNNAVISGCNDIGPLAAIQKRFSTFISYFVKSSYVPHDIVRLNESSTQNHVIFTNSNQDM